MGGAASSVKPNAHAPSTKRNDLFGLLKMRLVLSEGNASALGSRLKPLTNETSMFNPPFFPPALDTESPSPLSSFDSQHDSQRTHQLRSNDTVEEAPSGLTYASLILAGRLCPPGLLVHLPVIFNEEHIAQEDRVRETLADEEHMGTTARGGRMSDQAQWGDGNFPFPFRRPGGEGSAGASVLPATLTQTVLERIHEEAVTQFWELEREVAASENVPWAASTLAQKSTIDGIIQLWRNAADKGLADAQIALGYVCGRGRGVKENHAEAFDWFKKEADQGSSFAQFNLGVMCAHGIGVEQNDVEAARWFRNAAEQGDANARFSLGLLYAQGKGVEQDDALTTRWFRMAADQGHTKSMFSLGVKYERGVRSDSRLLLGGALVPTRGRPRARAQSV